MPTTNLLRRDEIGKGGEGGDSSNLGENYSVAGESNQGEEEGDEGNGRFQDGTLLSPLPPQKQLRLTNSPLLMQFFGVRGGGGGGGGPFVFARGPGGRRSRRKRNFGGTLPRQHTNAQIFPPAAQEQVDLFKIEFGPFYR